MNLSLGILLIWPTTLILAIASFAGRFEVVTSWIIVIFSSSGVSGFGSSAFPACWVILTSDLKTLSFLPVDVAYISYVFPLSVVFSGTSIFITLKAFDASPVTSISG